MKARNILIAITLGVSSLAQSQESPKLYFEQFRIGVGVSHLKYIDWPASASGQKIDLALPIYDRLFATLSYSQFDNYFDYCDEIPVEVGEQHFVFGASYALFERGNWSFSALAAFDVERTTYTEVDHLPKKPLSNDGTTEMDDHSDIETYLEGLIGIEANLMLSKRFQLSATSRLNTYGGLTNSFGVNYLFNLGER